MQMVLPARQATTPPGIIRPSSGPRGQRPSAPPFSPLPAPRRSATFPHP